MKFGTPKQFAMPITMNRSKSQADVKFQHGGRPFSETGCSNNSAVDWDISSKSGMQIHFYGKALSFTDELFFCFSRPTLVGKALILHMNFLNNFYSPQIW